MHDGGMDIGRRGVAVVLAGALQACPGSPAKGGAAAEAGVNRTEGGEVQVAPATEGRLAERRALVRHLAQQGIRNSRVLAAMEKVPRHLFVPEAFRELSYRDRPLPIGHGQTISQPFVVARMSEVADVQPHETCLEVGTGSGYQAAVLAELCKKVYSIEYLPEVAKLGAEQLRGAGYGAERVALRVGDGYGGWAEAAPFDAILVTAAPEQVPAPLLEQLAVGGKLVIPVGPTDGEQVLERWTRTRPGAEPSAFVRERLMGVRFVPFLGDRAERQGR